MLDVITISHKGQVDLPPAIRVRFGLQQGDRVIVTVENDRIILQPLDISKSGDWRQWRGILANTDALAEHLTEHAAEVANDRLP